MGKPACTGSALPQVQRRTNRVYRSLIGSALCRTAGSTVSGLGGSGGGLGGLGGDWDILDTLCLVRFRKPRTVQLAGSHLLFCPDQDFLGSPLALHCENSSRTVAYCGSHLISLSRLRKLVISVTPFAPPSSSTSASALVASASLSAAGFVVPC